MAEQRRYTADQVRRIQESGEAPPQGMSTAGRILRNAAVAVPRAFTDLSTMFSMAVPAIRAGLSDELDFPEAMFGKEGIAEIQNYVATKTEEHLAALPQERRTERNRKAIQDAISNSQAVEEIMFKHNPAMATGMRAGNTLNEAVGLQPVRKETITDDLSQIATTALIPSGLVTKPLAKLATKGAIGRATKLAADVVVPGTAKYGPTGVAANTVVPLAASQGLRAVTDQPSLITGDALGADEGVNAGYEPDADPQSGLGGEQLAAIAGGTSAVVLGAAVMLGKANKLAAKQALDAVDNPKLNPDELQPTLGGGQQVGAAFDDSAPLRDYLSNAYGGPRSEGFRKNIGEIERVINDTASVNHQQMRDAVLYNGVLDGLDRKTVPVAHLFNMRSQLPPDTQKIWDDYIIAMDDLDNHTLKLNTAKEQEQLAAAGVRQRGAPDTIAKHRAIQAQVAALEAEDAKLDSGLTVKQAKELDARIKADPTLAGLTAAHRRVYDDLLDAEVGQTFFTKEAADKMRGSRPNYMFKQEQDEPITGSVFMRAMQTLKEAWRGSDRPTVWGGIRGPVQVRTGNQTGETVKKPLPPMEALIQRIHDHIDYTTRNTAKRAWVKTMQGTPDWGKTVREVHSMPVDQFYKEGLPDKVKKAKLADAYIDNGTLHVFQVADELTHRALQFHRPQMAGVGLNLSRKMAQQGTTGWMAPEFAPISAAFDQQIIGATKQPGRSFGMIDATLRKAFPNSQALNAVLDKVNIDPTQDIQMIVGAFSQISQSAVRTVATKLAEDIRTGSGVGSILGRQGGLLERAAESMIRTLNDTKYGMALRARALDAHLLDDPVAKDRPKFEAVASMMTGPLRGIYRGYLASLDAIHNSAKYAFFAQNIAVLQKKFPNGIPEGEIKKLASETRRSSGDMTRAPGNWHLAKTASTIPYANIAINSALHLGQAIRRDPVNVGARILTGTIIPKVAAIATISSIPALGDWYWNELTPWQRLSSIPVIGPSWWMDLAQGKQRPVEKSDIYLKRETPEISMISNQVVSALRSMGMFGPESEVNASFTKDFFRGMEGMTSLGVPPVLKVLMNGGTFDIAKIPYSMLTGEPFFEEAFLEDPQQYGNPTGINADSIFSRGFANLIGSLFGVANQNMLNSIDLGMQSYDKDGSIADAFRKVVEFDTYQRERRTLEMPGTREIGATLFTDGLRRQYAGTARRLHVNEAMAEFAQVKSQLSAERDNNGAQSRVEDEGLEGFEKIQDPRVLSLAREMNQQLGRGKMLSLGKERSALGSEMVLIDANKENMSPRSYHLRSVALRQKVDDIDKQMEDVILNYEASLAQRFGPNFDISAALDVIKGSLGRSGP